MNANWIFTDGDKKIRDEIQSSLPQRLFDAHAHLYRVEDLNLTAQSLWTQGPEEVNIGVWRDRLGKQVGNDRLDGAICLATPLPNCNIERVNGFIVEQMRTNPSCRGFIAVTPEMTSDEAEALLDNPGIAGFKPYHVFSSQKPTFESSPEGFIPEWAWELADERGLAITLHMVRALALADSVNQRYIREMCEKYSRARLILAHCARGFNARHVERSIGSLRGLQNVWFDTAAICEAQPILAILNEFGPRKVLWGSDFPVSESRGRAVTVGDGFLWLTNTNLDWADSQVFCEPTLVGLESTRALLDAAEQFGLNSDDLQDVFCDNARRLLGMKQEYGTLAKDVYTHAKKRIPGGVGLMSKRPEMHVPGQWPAHFREARGCEVWDLDGRHYYDVSIHGIGACLLGFRDPDVTKAVRRRVSLGSMSTQSPAEEVELADLLCDIHPWAEQVRFARCGGEIASIAVRIARATTDRSVVAICGYHGWHDWYLATNLGESDALRGHLLPGLEPLGVPRELRGTVLPFRYNSREQFQEILDAHGSELAAVIMEPCRLHDPDAGLLEYVRDGAHKNGALLIFDEITIGWRTCLGGSHRRLGVNPDMALFAKSLGNGHPIAAVIGTSESMAGAHSSFISSTYWTEGVGPAAAVATVRKHMTIDVPAHADRVGRMVADSWRRHAASHKLPVTVGDGYPCLASFSFDHELSKELKTLYAQLMLKRGFLAALSFYGTLAHTDEVIALYDLAIDEVFGEIADSLARGDVLERLEGPVAHSTFQRLI